MVMSAKVEGVTDLVNRLSKFDKDVSKILTKEINEASRLVSNEAKSLVPDNGLSRWGSWLETTGSSGQRGVVQLRSSSRSLDYTQADVRSKIRPQFAKTRRVGGRVIAVKARVVTMSPAGAIFALAGSKGTGTVFKQNLNKKHGQRWPRVLADALYAKGPDARRGIEQAIDKAAKAVVGRGV
jgi:hypothetical protein